MTIFQIVERTRAKQPKFFSPANLKFFRQSLSMFKVQKQPDGRYKISAPMTDHEGKNVGETIRFFNPKTNDLDFN